MRNLRLAVIAGILAGGVAPALYATTAVAESAAQSAEHRYIVGVSGMT